MTFYFSLIFKKTGSSIYLHIFKFTHMSLKDLKKIIILMIKQKKVTCYKMHTPQDSTKKILKKLVIQKVMRFYQIR